MSIRKKIGILGLGSIGSRHLKNFKDIGCDVRGYDPYVTNIDPVLHDRNALIRWADAIVIATPISQHADDIFDCDSLGKPCLVEKPMADRGIGLFLFKVVVMVGYNLRFHSCVKRAKALMGEGAIGKPLWARFTCAQHSNKPAYLRDGVVLNWSHEIDLALFLLGKATLKSAVTDPEESIADLLLTHEINRCQTSIHLDYVTRWERRGFVIVGEKGSIEVDLIARQLFHRDNTGRFVDTYYGRDSFDSNYVNEARAFLDRLDGRTVDGCTAEEAMDVVGICLAAKEKANVQ